jgi:hypothetical protein
MNVTKILAWTLLPIVIGTSSTNLIGEPSKQTNQDTQDYNCKLILGGVERFLLPKLDTQITARVDTGATLSSISAHNVQIYEQNNVVHASFDMATDNGLTSVKIPVQKFIQVKQQAEPKPATRPVILLEIKLGSITGEFEFSLSDRSHLSSKALIGRNILRQQGVVDVSQQFLQSGENDGQKLCDDE